MTFDHPTKSAIPQLLTLWKEAFGDWDGFWETFLETGFAPERCRCVTEAGEITAALTWLNCSCHHDKMAYIYAVVTNPAHRGRGLCRRLLADTHSLLKERGYSAALLVPADPGLRAMYEKLGYKTCTFAEEFTCEAGSESLSVRAVGPEEFVRLRREFLPEGSVLQEAENIPFLARQAQFYAGDDFLLTAWCDDEQLTGMELLGNKAAAPGILRALGVKKGSFRCPGPEIPFAMIYPLRDDSVTPSYLGFAFD